MNFNHPIFGGLFKPVTGLQTLALMAFAFWVGMVIALLSK